MTEEVYFNIWVPRKLRTHELVELNEQFVCKLASYMLYEERKGICTEKRISHECVISPTIPIDICMIIFDYLTLNDLSSLCSVNYSWFALSKPRFEVAIRNVLLKSNGIKHRYGNSTYNLNAF